MSETLSFPGINLQFEMNRVAFTVGGKEIYWYGIIIASAFLAASAYVLLRSKKFGLDSDRVMDVVLGGVLLGIVGARLYYVIFQWDTYALEPASAFYIWQGGIAIYGGIIGGVLAAILVCRWRQVKLLPMLDLAAGGLLLGQAIGRWGNFVNMEAFGRNTTSKWGMTSNSIVYYLREHSQGLSELGVKIDPNQPVHPTFFYESMWCLLGFLFLTWYAGRRRFDGELGLLYLSWYGLGRFFIESLRTDSLLLGTVRVSQVLALLCVLAAGLTLIIVRSNIKRANDPDYLKLYADTDEGKAVVAGEFYKKKDKPSESPAEDAEDTEDAETVDAPETSPPEEADENDDASTTS